MKVDFKLKFIIILFLSILLLGMFNPCVCFAKDPKKTEEKQETQQEVGKEYLAPDQFDKDTNGKSYNSLENFKIGETRTVGSIIERFLMTILSLVRIIAVGWAIVMAISIATKYMTGSSQIKSQIKTDMPTYIIGAVILFGAAGLLTFIKYFITQVLK